MNLLTLKRAEYLNDKDKILYHPYKNIVNNFYKLATEKNSVNFDIIEKYFRDR